MAGQRFTLSFDANLNVSQMKSALGSIQSELNKLNIPSNVTKNLTDSIANIQKEVQNFEVLAGKDLTKKSDFNALEKSAQKIIILFNKLQVESKDLLNTNDLSKLFPKSVSDNINKANKALSEYKLKVKDINNEVNRLTRLRDKWDTTLKLANTDLSKAQGNVDASNKAARLEEIFKKVGKDTAGITNAADIKEAISLLDDLIKKAEEYNNKVQTGTNSKGKPYADSTKKRAQAELDALNQLKAAYQAEEANLQQNTAALAKATSERDKAAKSLRLYQTQLDAAKNTQSQQETQAINDLFNALSTLNGIDLSQYQRTLAGAEQALKDYIANSKTGAADAAQTVNDSVNNQSNAFQQLMDVMRQANQERQKFDNGIKDVDALRSRIQYFFGLNNTINLVKRALRGAYQTIKELDKAMTETAVVTNFSVGDMWKQLPEYTKRANELGVTTKAAYEAATLYYQQGLTTKEVTELSVETLKMARIAGLEAADATDRMTNALRGFNMELNAMNAQRVDDVYSRLAAISASNVDEISTAMTKVASLAHNTGAEFETTAAFLAQIIETTRESAETAGTALKTVFARFSEVKKLVSEGELKGEDNEGELINVNKVSEALRTAGIDLNKYFLGEVGLDDIFMELASKWDSLNSVQQRYIATQAAGSRQQSRFIALMSDYARTQELVTEAYNAEGAAAKQFEKTQDSLESKLARLKNAWDEFLMGLTNSTVVKKSVDILTGLLNVVNNLTDVFGEGVGSILKWALAIGSLRTAAKLFQKGGGISALLSGSFGATLGGSAFTMLKGFGAILGGGTFAGGAAVKGIFGVILALKGLLPILLAIGAAIGTIYGVYQAWLHLTPAGHIKLAEKHAKKLQDEAVEAQDAKKSYEELNEALKKYNESYQEASTISERKSIIAERNDAIRKALEEHEELNEALTTKFDDVTGELVLELNSDAVEDAAVRAAEKATDAAVKAYFGQADVELARAEEIAAQQKPVYRTTNGFMPHEVLVSEGDTSQATEALRQSYLAAAASQARMAYSTIISSSTSKISTDLGNALTNVLTDRYRETQETYDMATVEAILHGLKDQILDENTIKALGAENYEFAITDTETDALFKELGIDTTSKEFETLAKVLNPTIDSLEEAVKQTKILIRTRAEAIKQMQEDNRRQLQERLDKNNIEADITTWSPQRVEQVEKASVNAEEVLDIQSYKKALTLMSQANEDELTDLQIAINSVNADDPISSFVRLQQTIRDTKGPAADLAQSILDNNQELYNAGSLLQNFLISDEYDDVLENIEKILKTNKSLGAADIKELAKESKSLNAFLKENIISARTLAKALTLVANGKLSFEQVNDSVLEVLENMYTFQDLVEDVHNFISDFDEGIDYGEGVDFLTSKTDELTELLDNWEFGNERTRNLYEMLFGKDYMKEWEKGDEYIRNQVAKMKNWLENDAFNFFSDPDIASGLGITNLGNNQLEWNITGKYEDLEAMVSDVAKVANISENAAKMLIEAFASHGDHDFITELQQLSENSAINAIIEQFNGGKDKPGKKFWSESELQAIADSLGISLQELKNKIQEKAGEAFADFKIYDVLTGQDLFAQFKENLELNGKSLSEFVDNFISDRQLDETRLRSALQQLGYQGDMLDDLASTIRTNLVEEGKIDEGTGVPVEAKFDVTSKGVTVDPSVKKDVTEAIQKDIGKEPLEVEVELQAKPKGGTFIGDLPEVNSIDGGNSSSSDTSLETPKTVNTPVFHGEPIEVPVEPKVNTESINKQITTATSGEGTTPSTPVKPEVKVDDIPHQVEEIAPPTVPVEPQVDTEEIKEQIVSATSGGTFLGGFRPTVQVDPQVNTQSIAEQLTTYSAGGNVDLTLRPVIPAEYLNQAGYEAGTGVATVFTSTFSNEAGDIAINFTPILADEKGNYKGVLTPDALQTYAEGVISGAHSDYLKLQIGSEFNGEDAIQQATEAAERIHQLQEEFYINPDTITEGVNQGANEARGTFAGVAEEAGNNIQQQVTTGSEAGAIEGSTIITEKGIEAAEAIGEAIKNEEIQSGEEGAAAIRASVDSEAEALLIGGILYEKIVSSGTSAAIQVANNIQAALSEPIYLNLIGQVQISGTTGGSGVAASGGLVKSAASGLQTLNAGPALTGEEAPEIIWNKEKGYAYIVGQNGPEFTELQEGDRVFNAAETRRILRNSAAMGGIVPAFGKGRWGPGEKKKDTGGSGSSSDSDSEDTKTPTVWQNELDWLYNLIQDIGMLERLQTKLAERHDRYLSDISKTGRDLYNTSKEQLDNLKTQRDNARERLTRRTQEMNEQIGISGYGNYVQWNEKDQTLEIDWDAIEALQDKKAYDEIVELIDRTEKIQDEIHAAQDTLWSTEKQIKDIEDRYLTDFTNYQSRVYDAVVYGYQQQIDKLSSLNDELNEANNAVLNSLQKEIDYSRQIRDNTDTQNQLADMEARLAYMRRDTTGANASEIRELEKQLAESRQSYEDTLIDQSLNSLKEANDQAAEQRERQINLMTAQLDYWKESGALWNEVNQLIASGIGNNGSLISGSDLEKTLQNAESWKGMSQEQREVWANDLILETNKAGAYLIKISEGLDGISKGVWANLPRSSVTSQKLDYGDEGYSTGGLNAHPGLAMLHGTPNEPEYVLNARQTDAFLRLSDVLPAMLGNDTGTMNNFGGNTFNLVMNVDQIANDYDVDRLVERVKQDIYDVSSYRNVNSIGFIR